MTFRPYAKNGFVVVTEPRSGAHSTVSFLGRDVAVEAGRATAGGILMPDVPIKAGNTTHIVDVFASDVPDITPGDRVLIYLGGDDGETDAVGISAFVPVGGIERAIVHATFVWAKLTPSGAQPLGNVVLSRPDPDETRRQALGTAADVLHTAASTFKANGPLADAHDDARVEAGVMATYNRVLAVGPKVRDIAPGDVICTPVTYSLAKIDVGGEQLHLSDADVAYFTL